MEQVATVEQAEPQTGSAAPGQDTSAPAPGDSGEATPPSFGTLYRQHVERRQHGNQGRRADASSAARETSAADEQPVSAVSPAGIPDPDGTTESQPATEQPKLSRKERKALHAAQPASTEGQPAADTSARPESGTDPVARVERAIDERLSKLETLLAPRQPASESDQAYASAYAEAFGDDAEFARRAQIAISPNNTLSFDEQEQLAGWAQNRKASELTDTKWKRNLSAAALSAAEAHGLDPQTVVAAASPADIFAAFVRHGESKGSTATDAKVAEASARADKAEAANRLLADELEALRERLPAGARRLVVGGVSAVPSPDGPPIDRERASGRQLLAAGLSRQARQANGTSRGAAGITRGRR